MIQSLQRTSLAVAVGVLLSACGGGEPETATAMSMSRTSSLVVSSATATTGCPSLPLNGVDAQTLTGASTPLQLGS